MMLALYFTTSVQFKYLTIHYTTCGFIAV